MNENMISDELMKIAKIIEASNPSPEDTYDKLKNFNKISLLGFARRVDYPELNDLKKMDEEAIITELISFLHGEEGDRFLDNPDNFRM